LITAPKAAVAELVAGRESRVVTRADCRDRCGRLECKSNTPMGIVRISNTAAATRAPIFYALPE
jgi:hypothetical protein